MFKLTIKFKNTHLDENTDESQYIRNTLKECIDLADTYYFDFEFNQYWKITGFVIEEL